MLPPGGGARTAPSAERHAAPWGEGRAPLRSVAGREVFEKGFEGEGAAADEPRVDLEDPVEQKKILSKRWGTKGQMMMMTHMKIRLYPSYHDVSVTWYLRSSKA